MIAYLEGKILTQDGESIVLDVHGVGYRVFCARATREVGDMGSFWITEIIREDRHDLYGFLSREEQIFFEQLMSVSGVGPKLAQKILSSGSVESLASRIQAGDIDMLTNIGGVGKKTAQKIILDLKGVLVTKDDDGMLVPQSDVSDALESLGYSKSDVASILEHVTGATTEERIKSALKLLSRHV